MTARGPDQSAAKDQIRRELSHILQQYAEFSSRLRSILEEEQAVLAEPKTTSLQAVVQSKEACVRQMGELESERSALCHRAGFDADNHGMQELIEWSGSSSDVIDAWRELIDSARRAEEINRINGAVGRVRQEQVLATLVVLHGSDQAGPTYGGRGQESARFDRRPLALA